MSDSKTPSGRMTEEGVRAIRAMRKELGPDGQPKTYQQIASAFGVSIGTVFNILTGRTWKWLA